MSYTALYRKFRPSDFNEVKGQEHIVTTLKNQIKMNRIGHAYLFCGTRGTGKTTVAKILAKTVNCEHPVDGNPCNECAMCEKINRQISMNVVEIDAASNNGVANIRDIIEEVQYSPSEGKYKVYIIDEVHMLSTGAFNALLKTLEEPPEYIVFILATTEPHKIPITILSRCQRYDFRRISIDTIERRLRELVERENVDAEEKALRYIARMADGSLRDGLSLLDQCIAFYLGQELTYDRALDVLGAVDTDVYSKMFVCVTEYNAVGCLELIDQMMTAGRNLNQFLSEFIWYLRNLLLISVSSEGEKLVDVSSEQMAKMEEESKKTNQDVLIRNIRILSELSNQIRYATQKRVLLETAMIKLCRPQMDQNQDMTTVLQRLQQLEKQIEEGVVTVAASAEKSQGTAEETAVTQEALSEEKVKAYADALPEDVKAIIKNWKQIVDRLDATERTFLAEIPLNAGEGNRLELLVSNDLDAGFFEQQDKNHLHNVEKVIQETIGKKVDIRVRMTSAEEKKRQKDVLDMINFDEVIISE